MMNKQATSQSTISNFFNFSYKLNIYIYANNESLYQLEPVRHARNNTEALTNTYGS